MHCGTSRFGRFDLTRTQRPSALYSQDGLDIQGDGQHLINPAQAPALPSGSELATQILDDVFLIDTKALGQRNVISIYLVIGAKNALIDLGYGSSVGSVLNELKELGMRPEEIDYLIPTHIHLDHAGATGALVEHMPRAQVVVQKRGAKHLIDPTKLIASATDVFGEEIMKLYGPVTPVPSARVSAVDDEAHIDIGTDRRLEIFWAPGHAPHQMCIHDREAGCVFTGDAVGLFYPGFRAIVPTTPPPSFEPDLAVGTIRKLIALRPRRLFIPHFGVIDKDVESFLHKNAERIEAWKDRVGEAIRRGEQFGSIVDAMLLSVAEEAEVPLASLPTHIRVSVAVSVKGYVRYFQSVKANRRALQ